MHATLFSASAAAELFIIVAAYVGVVVVRRTGFDTYMLVLLYNLWYQKRVFQKYVIQSEAFLPLSQSKIRS